MKLKLTPKTLKGKRAANQAGTDVWIVVEKRDSVGFSEKSGPWYYVRPDINGQPTDNARWVNATDDADFSMEIME